MKTTVKILAASLLLLVSLNLSGQSRFGATAGYLSTRNISSSIVHPDTDTENGLYIGVLNETTLTGGLGVEVGVVYALLNYKYSFYQKTIHAVHVPIHLTYKYFFSPELAVFGFAGVTGTVGVSATWKEQNNSYSLYSGDYKQLNRLDIKPGIGAGIEFAQNYQLRVGYDWGMLNQRATAGSESSPLKVNYFHVGFAYMF